jgi:hypothetical protein
MGKTGLDYLLAIARLSLVQDHVPARAPRYGMVGHYYISKRKPTACDQELEVDT